MTQTETNNTSNFDISQAVVAIELGNTDEKLLNYLELLAKLLNCKAVYFLHVVPVMDYFNTEEYFMELKLDEHADLQDDMIDVLKRTVDKYFQPFEKMRLEYDVRTGNPLEEVLQKTKELNAELVIIGQKHYERSHGILARNLAREVDVNALVVPEDSKLRLDNILVPIDFSENSVRALHTAMAIKNSAETDLKITCLNIYEMPNFSYYKISRSPSQIKSMVEANIKEGFRAFINKHAGNESENIDTVLVNKELPGIAGYIVEFAEDLNADLIVMGAKGHSKVELLLMGSVTEKLLDLNNDMPTLVVK